ncbi:PREDICTED: phytochrome A-associated F-box protein [Ipomoea nil]|uniref:phytochrome A-associated F-box protein n=1 Tax=Ipomoea nil TaxID=35883 RepID=UPI0009015FEF|nr:PREDICTED: phytochrome A-associated F-box protein [Ipomoea nil]
MAENAFSVLSDDIILNIFYKLEDDPRYWARLACVSTKFSSLIRDLCCKSRCSQAIPAVVSDLLSAAAAAAAPPGGWAALYKLAFCCPGLLHSGVLLENSDFGLERELGADENFTEPPDLSQSGGSGSQNPPSLAQVDPDSEQSGWSLFDDLMFDTICDVSESSQDLPHEIEAQTKSASPSGVFPSCTIKRRKTVVGSKRRKIARSCSHLATGPWNLSREQGIKLLASRFREDCLYICDWPGCLHLEQKRNYMLFRGIFKNFKQSRVWRTINDGNRKKIDLNCAFCNSKQTWDLHSAFCLRRYFGFHDDGEPVVRAYVCENGHVSGAWTDWSLYT